MFEDFPNLHPLVVHFPIVLILISAALQAVLVFKDWPPVRWITLGIMAGGFAGALATSTVFHAMPMGLSPQAADVFSAHEQYASYALWLSGITLLLGGVGEFFQLRRRAFDVLVLVAALAAAGSVSVAGHHGAQLVYIEGVGPQGRLLDKSHGHGGGEIMTGMDMAGSRPARPARPASRADAMQNTPGMEMPASKSTQPMPAGMDMSRPNRPKQMGTMPEMENMPHMNKPAAGAKKPAKAKSGMEGMGNMADMPGMKAPSPKQPNQAKPPMGTMKDMPSMEKGQAMPTMPGMSMPASPMDKFRFEDNNPARNNPKTDKQ